MKNKTLRLFLILLYILVSHAAVAVPSHREYTKENPLIYEDSRDLWPYVFLNKRGQPSGMNVEIVKSLLERLKIPYKIRLCSTEKVFADLHRDSADLSLGMRTDYNADYAKFGTKAIVRFTHSMLSPKRYARKKLLTDSLRNISLVVHRGSMSHHHLLHNRSFSKKIIPADNMEEVVLNHSVADTGIVVWNTMSLKFLKTRYDLDNLVLTPVDIPEGAYHFMSNDEHLLQRLDSAFMLMKTSGELHAITTRWLYPENQTRNRNFTIRSVNILSIIAFIMLLALFYIYYKRRHVVKLHLADVVMQMDLVLHANNTRVWVYYPQERRYAWMDSDGVVNKEYSSYEFSRFYNDKDFDIINKHIQRLLNDDTTPALINVSGYKVDDTGSTIVGTDSLSDFEIHIKPLCDEYGKVYIVVGVQHDITHDKSQLNRKRELTHRYAAIFHTEYHSTYKFDASGVLVSMNHRALEITPTENMEKELAAAYNINSLPMFTKEQLLSCEQLYFSTIIPADEMGSFLPFVCVSKLPFTPFYPVTPTHYYIEVELNPILNEQQQLVNYILNLRDLTDFVDECKQIGTLDRKYKGILKSNQTQLERINYSLSVSDMLLTRFNPDTQQCQFTKALGGEVLTFSQLELIERIDVADLKLAFKVLHELNARTDKNINVTLRTNVLNGKQQQRIMHFDMRPMYDAENNVSAYFGVCSDITEQLESQKQLEYEKERAYETEQLKKNFLRNMSYRIRTPLVAISQGINRLARISDAEQQSREIDGISGNSSRLISLSDDTLYLSRLDAGLLTVKLQATDFAHLFSTAFDSAIGRYRNEEVNYIAENSYSSLVLNIDPDIMMRIVRNSIALSARYTSYGMLRARYVHRRDTLSIYIEDSGQGIDPSMLERIYEPRMGGEYDMKDDLSSGLEMAIVKSLIDLLGGTIDIDSIAGRGTSIAITLNGIEEIHEQ